MQKLYCYVDTTGQDTKGDLFLVSVVVTGAERDNLGELLGKIEQQSGKRAKKWSKAEDAKRSAYVRQVPQEPAFKGKLHFAVYRDSTEYLGLTAQTVAGTITRHTRQPYRAIVIVDGLRKSERRAFAVALRELGVRTEKVRGATERADVFIRLADALCGFLRDGFTGREEFRRIIARATQEGFLTQVRGEQKNPRRS